MKKTDDQLIALCQHVEGVFEHAGSWINDNKDLLNVECDAAHRMIKRLGMRLSSLQSSVARRPCLGVIGPDRSGKTHLIAGLAGRGAVPLKASFDGLPTAIDYIGDICGDTSYRSGIVTRFTIDNAGTPTKFPVAVELLSVVDIITILATSYLSGSATGVVQIPSSSEMEELATRLGRKLGHASVPGLNDEDIWTIRDRLERKFSGMPAIRDLAASGYWDYFFAMMPRLSSGGRTALLSVLWGKSPFYSSLFDAAFEALDKLGHERKAYCEMSSLCLIDQSNGTVRARPDGIMSIMPLFRFGRSDDETVLVRSKHGAWAAIRQSLLAMLVAEVRIHLADADSPLFAQSDVLEFPGMRAGQGGYATESKTLAPKGGDNNREHRLLVLFAGHKAEHLFNDYHARRELTCLVACADVDQPDLSNWSGSVASWISDSHAANPRERGKLDVGLFLVLTKLDELILRSHDGVTVPTDWSARVKAALLDGLGRNHNWPGEWTPGRAFKNIFLLRSPHHRETVLCDYLDNGLELCIKSNRTADVMQARTLFLENAEVANHISDPQSVWNESVEPGDGGISYLAQSLCKLCNGSEKYRQIAAEITKLRYELGQRIQRFYASDDSFAQHEARHSSGHLVLRAMQHCCESKTHGQLLRLLSIEEDEILSLFHNLDTNPYRDNINYAPPVVQTEQGAAKTLSDSLQTILGAASSSNTGSDNEQLAEIGHENQGDQQLARNYACALMCHWAAGLRNLTNSSDTLRFLEISAAALSSLVDELLTAANRHDLEAKITKAIEAGLTKQMKMTAQSSKAAMVAAEVIGEFVHCLGFSEKWAEHHPRRKGRARTIIFPPRLTNNLSALEETRSKLGIAFSNDWSIAYLAMVEDDVEYLQRTRFDLDEDRLLGKLLGELLPAEVWPVFRSSL